MAKFFSISLLYALILSCGSMTFGSIIAFGSATLRIMKDVFGPLPTFYIGAFQAAPAMSAIIAPLFWSFLLKRLRLKIVSFSVGLTGVIFWPLLLTTTKKYFWTSIIIRAMLGMTLAGISTIGPLYFTQIAPPELKGFYGTLHSLFVIMGHIVTNLLGVTHKWQPPIYVSTSLMFIFGTFVFVIPDVKKDDQKGTEKQIELNDINSNNDSDINANIGLFDASHRRRTLVAMTLAFFMSFSGIGSIMQNIAPLMSEVGLELDAGYQAAIAICAQFFSCFLSSILIDKLGFKFLWNLSALGSSLSLLFYGLNVKFEWSRLLPMIFLFSFQFFFGIGLGSIPWILPSIIFPPELKSKAMSLTTSLVWAGASIVMFLFPFLQKWFGQFGLMMILSGLNALNLVIGILFVENYKDKNQTNIIADSNDIKQNLISGEQGEVDESIKANLL